MKRDAVEDRVS